MERNPQSDKYLRAKIEEPNLRLPKNLLKPGSDPTDDLYYLKIYENDNHKAVHLAQAVASGAAEADRKVYRIRKKEVLKLIEKGDELLKHIHCVSKATIGLLADSESDRHRQSYLDLLGTVEEVRTAEELILDAIIKTYVIYPIILMPPTLYQDKMIVPLHKVGRILGTGGNRILALEIESGTWIKIDPVQPASCGLVLVSVYGPESNVIKAVPLIESLISEGVELVELRDDGVALIDEMASVELEDEKQQHDEQEAESEKEKQMKGVEGKAIVDHQFRVPKSVPKVDSNKDDDRYYIELFGTQPKTDQSSDTDSSVKVVERKLFRIRNTDLNRVLRKDNKRISDIHTKSGTTIGILSDTQIQIHCQSYLELSGTPEQVKIAELLIVDAITETYDSGFIPPALMPTCICHQRMTFPIYKAARLSGVDGNNIVRMEMQSGAWIEVDTVNPPPGGKAWERVLTVYGPMKQVAKANTMIRKTLYEGENTFIEEFDSLEEAEYKKRADLEDEIRQYYERQAEYKEKEKQRETQKQKPQNVEE